MQPRFVLEATALSILSLSRWYCFDLLNGVSYSSNDFLTYLFIYLLTSSLTYSITHFMWQRLLYVFNIIHASR